MQCDHSEFSVHLPRAEAQLFFSLQMVTVRHTARVPQSVLDDDLRFGH